MSLVEEKLKLLPDLPGCYLHKDKNNTIIYVGKAKNLKNRVKSYFTGVHNAKTTKLVSEIADFEYIITNSELESLVLEINLIKKHNPKYNIMLTDDKTYPYIALTNETNPRVIVTRGERKKTSAKYFGPYPNVGAARKTVDIINRTYPFRKCAHIPNKECLYYHMHNCFAPCINKEEFDYQEMKNKVARFLNGDSDLIIKELYSLMEEASNKLDFEKAMEYRDMINDINNTTLHQKIVINDFKSKDIIGIYASEEEVSIHILIMRNGCIVQNNHAVESFVKDYKETVENYLFEYYNNECLRPKEILILDYIEYISLEELYNIKIETPLKGKKKELLDMATTNAKKDLTEKRLLYQNQVLRKVSTVNELGVFLGIKTPNNIEAFDNSNLFGEYPVSAMVSYKDGVPSKNDYRKYHIKTVTKSNDYETMKEVIYRRYYRLLMENSIMPDLIIMDGGEIQVHAALDIINSLHLSIPVMGLQKDSFHKATAVFFNEKLIPLKRNTDVFLFLSNISQTVHDFAISFFRGTKAKGMFSSRLDGIKGLGPKGKEKLIKAFINVDSIKNAKAEDIEKLGFNATLAQNIINHLNEDNN